METRDEIIAKLPSAEDMVKRVIELLRRNKPIHAGRRRKPRPLWSRVSETFGHGSGYSWAICRKYGFNADETWRGEE